MATISDATNPPSSGLRHIDALLDTGPGWNWVTPARTTLYYSYSLAGIDSASLITGALTPFNVDQQAAASALLTYVSTITGISFVFTADGAAADLHFAAGNITDAGFAGYCSWNWSYTSSGPTLTSYVADATIFLDNVDYTATTTAPTLGNGGHELLLHEIGHAMGLKHPFAGGTTLPGGEDNTSYTLMSYTHVGGPYGAYSPYDIATLMWLYGGDGLGGALGQGGALYLVGTATGDVLTGSTGNDTFEGGAGNDTIAGGAGSDTARYSGASSLYTITTVSGGHTINGPDGTDSLSGVEWARFADITVALSGGGNSTPTGGISITGTSAQGAVLTAVSTLADADGMGTLAYVWQSSPDATTWTPISGATGSTFTPGQTQVGLRIRVTASYTDGGGTQESATSTATVPVVNVNDPPTGALVVTGTARNGYTLQATPVLADADGLGVLVYQWQASGDGATWLDLAGASGPTFTAGAAQVGLMLRVRVTYIDGQGQAELVQSAATAAVLEANRAPTGTLTVGGTPAQGQALSAVAALADADGLGELAYRWQASADGTAWADIGGATAAQFTPGQAQVGQQLRVVASYVDAQGTAETFTGTAAGPVANVNDAPSGGVAVSGTSRQGQVLQAQSTLADADGLGALAYQWQASPDGVTWTDLGSATAASYTPGEAQVGQRLRVAVHYTDGFGHAESATSAATAVVTNLNDAPTGSVTLAGDAVQTLKLTAAAALADADGLGTYEYLWQSSATGSAWAAISGASGATATLGAAQVGQVVRVVVRYTDGHGTVESVASASTTPVAAAIAGTAQADTLSGTAAADVVNGLGGNDRLSGAAGNDRLFGEAGLDTAVYALARAAYTVGAQGASVQALQGSEGSDALDGIERIEFADGALAFDLSGHAGATARILGAVFGPAAVGNAGYAGIGLRLLDGGMGDNELMQLALDAALGSGFSHAALVTLLYTNLVGQAPGQPDLDYWTGTLASGQYTPVALAWMAAELELNAQNIGLAGLADTGLAYLPG